MPFKIDLDAGIVTPANFETRRVWTCAATDDDPPTFTGPGASANPRYEIKRGQSAITIPPASSTSNPARSTWPTINRYSAVAKNKITAIKFLFLVDSADSSNPVAGGVGFASTVVFDNSGNGVHGLQLIAEGSQGNIVPYLNLNRPQSGSQVGRFRGNVVIPASMIAYWHECQILFGPTFTRMRIDGDSSKDLTVNIPTDDALCSSSLGPFIAESGYSASNIYISNLFIDYDASL